MHSLCDHLYIRRTDEILRRALKISRPDRNNEVRQLITVVASEPDFRILRTDLHSFFETVIFSRLIDKLETNNFRNHSTIAHLRSINTQLVKRFKYPGLPRGLSISSTLADYALQEIDKDIFANPSTIYYTRYVDDICVVHLTDNKTFEQRLVTLLKEQGLTLNRSKTVHLEHPFTMPLEFLGYSIDLEAGKVSIAHKKIIKAKRRIALTLQAFIADKLPTAYVTLRDRLRFLSSVVELNKVDRASPVFSGFRHVYRECTKDTIESQLRGLDTFLHGIIHSRRYKLGNNIRAKLTAVQLAKLKKISFRSGYEKNIVACFQPDRIAALTKAWRYE